MSQILIPTTTFEDWKRLLAKPELHWREGYSAMTLARSWESSREVGFPPEVAATLRSDGDSGWGTLRLLLAIPEYQVKLPGGERPSQTDLMAIARGINGLTVIAVEGKVDETLGPTVGEKRAEQSHGVKERLQFLLRSLSLPECPDAIRYQLLHRTVSALLVARDFAATSAVMLVHSFSPTSKWLSDFQAFARLFSPSEAEPGKLIALGNKGGIGLFVGWCVGDQRYRVGDSVS